MNITIDPAEFENEVNRMLFTSVCRTNGMDGDFASIGIMDRAGYFEQLLAALTAFGSQNFSVPLQPEPAPVRTVRAP